MSIIMVIIIAIVCVTIVCVMGMKATSLIRAESKRADDYQRELERFANNYNKEVEKISRRYSDKIQDFKSKIEKENIEILSQALSGSSATKLIDETSGIVDKYYKKMSQELLGNISDETEGLSRDFHLQLCEKVWDSIQQFKEHNNDSPYIMPKDCKIAYTKGDRTVIVIEQEPQVRTISVHPQLVSEQSARVSVSQGSNSYRFSLAFPYVYFFIAFDKGKYNCHELYFRNKPITSVREHVYLAPIPNVWRDKTRRSNNSMCMGRDFRVDNEITIARQAELVVSDFWFRTFNSDLGTGGYEKVIGSWKKWQDQTKSDPLFILNTNWQKAKTVKGVVQDLLDNRTMKHQNDPIESKLRKILDDGVANITKKLKLEIEAAKTHNDLKKSKVEELVRSDLEKIICQHTNKVFEICSKN